MARNPAYRVIVGIGGRVADGDGLLTSTRQLLGHSSFQRLVRKALNETVLRLDGILTRGQQQTEKLIFSLSDGT